MTYAYYMTTTNRPTPRVHEAGRTGRRNTGDPAGTYTTGLRLADRSTTVLAEGEGTITLAEYRLRMA
jgi:hypothetical protein